MIKCLLSQSTLDRVEEWLILFEINMIKIEFVLLVPECSLFKDLGNLVNELFWIVCIFSNLFLHVTGKLNPLVKFDVFRINKVGNERLDGDVESTQVDLAECVITVEASSEIRNILMEQMVFFIILH